MTGPGLSSDEAKVRLDRDGPNELLHEDPPSALAVLVRQFKSPMVALLLGAAGLAGALGERADAIAIGAIVLLNGVVGFVQEHRAEQALQALRGLTAPRARVLRDGRARVVPAAEVVVGDVLVLEAGDLVAADARLVEAHALSTDESLLTGESLPVDKGTEPAAPDAPLAERQDRVFLGTAVARGTGAALVEATGMRTEMGRIAQMLATAESGPTPLQEKLAALSRSLLWICLGIVAVVALLGWWRGMPAVDVMLAAVSLAVASVPEGLAAVVTIALAMGVQRMARRHVLIRRLPAVETLGAVTVICTDKTGTLTKGEMRVREVWGRDEDAVVHTAAACCDAELGAGEEGVGDPTEIAILLEARARGTERALLETEDPRREVIPFDAATKRMAVLRQSGRWFVKGAPEVVKASCVEGTDGLDEALSQMAARGLRVLAVATGTEAPFDGLRLVGLLGLADPPRPEATAAVTAARRGGIRTVMITGDHPVTARAIARELGILGPGDDPTEVVLARATPEDKIRTVRAWKERGAVVAMTGDGVNDAPAIREAQVGVAMGLAGTEVTREAAAIVLTDDNYASIVEGVREGRAIYDNIQKTLVYLLSGNAGELLLMLTASLLGLPLPLLPLHLLWINLLTDGLPALALVMDPPDGDVLSRPPRPPDRPVLAREEWRRILLTGALEAAVTLGVFIWTLPQGEAVARDLAFTTLVFGELFRSFAARSATRVFWRTGVLSNLVLLLVVGVSLLFQIAVHYMPWTQALFAVHPLGVGDFALALGLGLVPVTVLEVVKLVRRLP